MRQITHNVKEKTINIYTSTPNLDGLNTKVALLYKLLRTHDQGG